MEIEPVQILVLWLRPWDGHQPGSLSYLPLPDAQEFAQNDYCEVQPERSIAAYRKRVAWEQRTGRRAFPE